jgi:hypothetical protein
MTETAASSYKSKTLATWIALIGGCVGLHRFYLHGLRDGWGWIFSLMSLLGFQGVQRMRLLGVDDRWAWVLIPFLGLALTVAMLTSVVHGLQSDDAWNAKFNPTGPQHRSGWLNVIGVIAALFVGASVLMATIAFSAQHYFEYQVGVAAP